MIAVVEVGVGNGARAAGAFGDVLPGHFQMHAAGIGALGLMHVEEIAHFLEDQIERPRLIARRRGDGIAVHRIARPQHRFALAFDRAHQRRQMLADLVGAETADQREPARLVVRIENVDQPQQVVGFQRRTAFEPDRILDAARPFDMGVIVLAGAVADPDHVARGGVPVAGRGIGAGEGLLVAEQQRFVAGVKVGGAERRVDRESQAAGAHEIERA